MQRLSAYTLYRVVTPSSVGQLLTTLKHSFWQIFEAADPVNRVRCAAVSRRWKNPLKKQTHTYAFGANWMNYKYAKFHFAVTPSWSGRRLLTSPLYIYLLICLSYCLPFYLSVYLPVCLKKEEEEEEAIQTNNHTDSSDNYSAWSELRADKEEMKSLQFLPAKCESLATDKDRPSIIWITL